jgi:uncharacterized secreted protein with C-terminal beta-propeller domain
MKILVLITISTGLFLSAVVSCSTAPGASIPSVPIADSIRPKKTMRAFRSEQELAAFLRDLAEKQKRTRRELSKMMQADSAAPASPEAKQEAQDKEVDSVTNVQHAGVDEGGIVKLHGNHLVVLRRGRLFTVAIGDGNLKPISAIDAFAPDIDPRSTWYDEMLISQDTIAVIGYSYERGGTEVGLFHIDGQGRLEYVSTYHLRSNDYYS